MLRVKILYDSSNLAGLAGAFGKTIKAIFDEQKPEAVYFADDRGQRFGYLFIEMTDASQISAFAVRCIPAFNARALGVEHAVSRFGKETNGGRRW